MGEDFKFGGVYFFNGTDIASKKVVKENGKTRYIIDFKNGITVKYPAQTDKKIIPNIQKNGGVFDTIDGAEIKVKEALAPDIELRGCRNCTVDTSKNNYYSDRVAVISAYSGRKSYNNKIIMDKSGDTAITEYGTRTDVKYK